ncbi:MAG: DUF4136 domain-containing protein [Pseudomonadota bacterium]
MNQTKRTGLRAILAVTAVSFVAACASTPPTPRVDYKQDYDFTDVKTLAFYDESGMVGGNNPVSMSDMERERIDTALENAFELKGFRVVGEDQASEADLLISWTLILNERTDVRTYQSPSTGFGYSRWGGYNRYSLYNCWNCTQTEVSVRNYTEGTFIVDLISPTLKRSVWRSEVQSRLKGEPSHDQGRYNAAAERILEAFPPLQLRMDQPVASN